MKHFMTVALYIGGKMLSGHGVDRDRQVLEHNCNLIVVVPKKIVLQKEIYTFKIYKMPCAKKVCLALVLIYVD